MSGSRCIADTRNGWSPACAPWHPQPVTELPTPGPQPTFPVSFLPSALGASYPAPTPLPPLGLGSAPSLGPCVSWLPVPSALLDTPSREAGFFSELCHLPATRSPNSLTLGRPGLWMCLSLKVWPRLLCRAGPPTGGDEFAQMANLGGGVASLCEGSRREAQASLL